MGQKLLSHVRWWVQRFAESQQGARQGADRRSCSLSRLNTKGEMKASLRTISSLTGQIILSFWPRLEQRCMQGLQRRVDPMQLTVAVLPINRNGQLSQVVAHFSFHFARLY